jgi:hypothetical protein
MLFWCRNILQNETCKSFEDLSIAKINQSYIIVSSTSDVRKTALLVLWIMGNWKLLRWVHIRWNDTPAKFHENTSVV